MYEIGQLAIQHSLLVRCAAVLSRLPCHYPCNDEGLCPVRLSDLPVYSFLEGSTVYMCDCTSAITERLLSVLKSTSKLSGEPTNCASLSHILDGAPEMFEEDLFVIDQNCNCPCNPSNRVFCAKSCLLLLRCPLSNCWRQHSQICCSDSLLNYSTLTSRLHLRGCPLSSSLTQLTGT